jgi:putative glycosyltransferase
LKKISLVTSLYRSASYVVDFHDRHLECLRSLNLDWEFIFVDDGSPDQSGQLIKSLIANQKNVKLVSLSRNFGQHAAMFAGMAHASGDFIYTADCDLEEEPENILAMFEVLHQQPEVDVVYSVVAKRDGGFLSKTLGYVFFALLDFASSVKVPHNQGWQRIMTKDYVDALLKYEEAESLPGGLMALAGFNQVAFVIEKKFKGTTTYSFKKRFVLAVNSLVAFSSTPLIFIALLGFGISTISFIFLIEILFKKLFVHNYQTGWISIFVSIWCVGGLILSSVGVCGIYIAKIFNQVKARPKYIVRKVFGPE